MDPIDDNKKPDGQRLPLVLFEDAAVRLRARRIFEHTDWEIGPDQHWLVTGENGAGKSSLARALVGRLPIVQGKLSYPGLAHPQNDIGYMAFERQRQIFIRRERLERARYFSRRPDHAITGRDVLAADFRNRPPVWRRFLQILNDLDAGGLLDRPMGGLSSGELQKLLLARSLTPTVRLLVLDEPYDGLDHAGRRRFNRIVASRLSRTQIVLITQRTEDTPDWITHEMLVRNCRVAASGRRHCTPVKAQSGSFPTTGPPPVERSGPAIESVKKKFRYTERIFATPPSAAIHFSERYYGKRYKWAKPDAVVEMYDVSVRYGRRIILDDLSWRVTRGQNWAVLGPNGSGKTTLLSLISADHPQAYVNDIRLFGRKRGSGESIWELKRYIGLISSEMHRRFLQAMPVCEVILSGFYDSVGLYRPVTVRQRESARRWMRFFGLSDLSRHCFMHLSYGQQRLVLIARAMVKSPALLILDEPCQGLDARHRAQVLALLDTLGSRQGTQLLYVTHHWSEMLPCIDHIFHLKPLETGGFTGVCEKGPTSMRHQQVSEFE